MNFKSKIVSIILFVSIVPYLFLMVYFGDVLKQKYYENTMHQMQMQLTLHVKQIDQYLNNIKRDMEFTSKLDVMDDILSNDIDKRITHLLEMKKEELHLIGDFHIVDNNNTIIISSDSAQCESSMTNEAMYGVDIFSHFNDKKIARLILHFSLENFTKFFQNTPEKSFYLLINGKKYFQTKTFKNSLQIRQALRFETNIELVLEHNQESFLNELEHYTLMFIFALFFGAFIIAWSANFLVSKILKPILSLSNTVEGITQTRDYSQKIAISGNDEVSTLAKAFQEMLKGISKALKTNQELSQEIEETQKEVVFTMGAIGESRSKETGNHVKRVAEYSKLLARLYGLSEKEAEVLKQASPMHDIGKVAIPDAVLNKPGRFDEAERKIMDTHAELGYEMLKSSKRELLLAAATVAHEHHEKWDGSGYPRGLAGDTIHIYGRITALADVFDALGSDRVYKKAWEDERIFKLFKEERAKHFDPKLIDIFFENLDQFLAIRDTFQDA